MPEAVDGDEREVLLGLAQVVERVGELDTVGDQEVHVLCKDTLEIQITLHASVGQRNARSYNS